LSFRTHLLRVHSRVGELLVELFVAKREHAFDFFIVRDLVRHLFERVPRFGGGALV
jgi:hypothetical protein